jgi:hypothetical protein
MQCFHQAADQNGLDARLIVDKLNYNINPF